jgi:predicted Zn-dependent peptidase
MAYPIQVLTNNNQLLVLVFMVRAGSIYESSSQRGISHFLEHLLFMSKTTSMKTELERIGGVYNAATSKDATFYYITTPVEVWKQAINIFYNLVRLKPLSKKQFEKEQRVVIEEMYLRDYGMNTSNLLYEVMFQGTPYAESIIGSYETITSLTQHDIKQYFKERYSDYVVTMSCDSKYKDDVEIYVNKKFNAYKTSMSKPFPFDLLGSTSRLPMVVVEHIPSKTHEVCIGFKGLPFTVQSNIHLNFVMHVLHNILFTELRENRGLTYSINVDNRQYAHLGLVYVKFRTSAPNITEIVELVLKTTHEFGQKFIAKSEFTKCLKSYKYMKDVDVKTNIFDDTVMHCFNAFYSGDIPSASSLHDITYDDLKSLCEETFNFANIAVILYTYSNVKPIESALKRIIYSFNKRII